MVCVCVRTLNLNYRAIHMDGPLIPLARKTVAKNQLTACSSHIALLFSLKVSRNWFLCYLYRIYRKNMQYKGKIIDKRLTVN